MRYGNSIVSATRRRLLAAGLALACGTAGAWTPTAEQTSGLRELERELTRFDSRVRGYRATVDAASVGLPDNVFVSVGLSSQDQADLDAFEEAVRRVPEVMDCYLMTGDFDYLLRVVAAGAADYERIHRQHLTRLPSVARVHSSFALRVVQDAAALPMKRGQD